MFNLAILWKQNSVRKTESVISPKAIELALIKAHKEAQQLKQPSKI